MRNSINQFLDFFYPIFKRFMPIETFRYAACGGINTMSGLLVWYVCYHFVFSRMVVNLVFYSFESYTLALLVSSSYSFTLGFLLNKYVVFTSSNLKGRIQLFRYFLSFAFNLMLNYFLLKCLVEKFQWDAFISQLLTTFVVIGVSYFSQKYFTFKIK
jgi:putative flippase GtrA